MIIFFAPGGRLGNVLFQYSFLAGLRKPGERILSTQLNGLHRIFRGMRRVYNSDSRLVVNLIDWLIDPIIYHLFVRFRLFSSLFEVNGKILKQKGIFPVTYIKGYFQSEEYSTVVTKTLHFRPNVLAQCQELFAEAEQRRPVFLHIRRGDYLTWSVSGIQNPSLPESYFRNGLSELLKASHGAQLHVFLLGDDPEWCAEKFSDLQHISISHGSPASDLALMSLCEGGVVSNSTFGWWGAAFCTRTLPIIGPRYWVGWKVKQWLPSRLETSWMQFVEVNSDNQHE